MGQQSGNNIMRAFQQGRQMAEEREYKNALATVFGQQAPPTSGGPAGGVPQMGGGGIVATPEQEAESAAVRARFPNAPEYADDSRSVAFQVIARKNPALAATLQNQEREARNRAQVAQLGQAAMNGNNQALGQLFSLDPDLWKRLDDRQRAGVKEATSFMAQSSMAIGRLPEAQRAQAWATSVQQAEAGGIDIPAYMERYSPDVLNAALARAEMTEKYIKQFEPDFRVIPQGGYLEDVNPVTAGQQQPATQQGPQTASVPVVPTDIFQADVQSLGLQGAIRFAVSKGLAVPISGDQEYALLPSGAAFVGPDGVARRKP
jgi:hypothetical protein